MPCGKFYSARMRSVACSFRSQFGWHGKDGWCWIVRGRKGSGEVYIALMTRDEARRGIEGVLVVLDVVVVVCRLGRGGSKWQTGVWC